jgi:hypothetical protein
MSRILPIAMGMVLSTFAGASATTPEAPTAAPMISLDRAVHFTAPDGSDLTVAAGTYRVEQAMEAQLRLFADPPQPAIEILATATTHEETVSSPVALAIAEEGQEDEVHLVLLLPNGQGLDAAGTFSGTRSRATVSPTLNYTQVQYAVSQFKVTPQQSMPLFRVPPAAAVMAKPAAQAMGKPIAPNATMPGAKGSARNVIVVQVAGQPVGPVTWGYLRMNAPETVLAMIKAVQAGARPAKSLTGLASPKLLSAFLKTAYPATSANQVTTRGLSALQTQVESSVILPNSGQASVTAPAVPYKPSGWNNLFTPGVDALLDQSKITQPKSPAQRLDPMRAVRLILHVDYLPEQLNFGSLYKDQTTQAIVQVTAPVDGQVTASIPTKGTPFRVVKVRALNGRLVYQPVGLPAKLLQVAREQETAQAAAAPFSVPAKSGQTVEVTVEFAPKFELFGTQGTPVGNQAASLEVSSDLWIAAIPVTGRFLGVDIGVMATPDTTDVVAYCPNAFAAGFTFINATGRPQQVNLISRSAPYDVYVNAVCTASFFACTTWENKPFTLSLAPGERKHVDLPMVCSYSPEEGPVSISYSYEGTTRPATFYVQPYPTAMRWEGRHTMPAPSPDRYPFDSCVLDWSLSISPDGSYATSADFGRFDTAYIDKSVERNRWAGVQVKLRGMNLGETWKSYKGFASPEDSPSPYTTGGKQMTFVTYKPSYGYPSWQGVLAPIQASYADLIRESPLVRLGCGVSGIVGDPDNPF